METFHLWIFLLQSFCRHSMTLEETLMPGRKDAATCCDKLENNTFSTNCQQTLLWAGEGKSYAYTPNFPEQFPVQKLCTWGIYARPGKRVRLEFPDFYLIGPGDDGICFSQGVIIKSPLSHKQMGPHCGNAGLPTIISAGNYLVVELVSNIPMTTENYRGFKMSFVESVEDPSPELRPPKTGYNTVLTADPVALAKFFPKPTVPSIKAAKSTSRKPSRFQPGRRLETLTPLVNVIPNNVHRGMTASRYHQNSPMPPPVTRRPVRPPPAPPKKEAGDLTLEEIVGIVVGTIVFLGIMILIAIKFLHNRKKKTSKQGKTKADIVTTTTPANIAARGSSGDVPNAITHSPTPGYYVYYYHDDERVDAERKPAEDHSKAQSDKKKRLKRTSENPTSAKKPPSKTKRRSLNTTSITRPTRRNNSKGRKRKSKAQRSGAKLSENNNMIKPSLNHSRRPAGRQTKQRADSRHKVKTAQQEKSDSGPVWHEIRKSRTESKSVKKRQKKSESLRQKDKTGKLSQEYKPKSSRRGEHKSTRRRKLTG